MTTTSLAVQRFFRTPKGLLLIVLVALTALAAPTEGIKLLWLGLLSSLAAASLTDMVVLRLKKTPGSFPSGAILPTALLVVMVLSPVARHVVMEVACAAVIGVLSKYAFRTKAANVFNPAALALVIAFYLFHTAQQLRGSAPRHYAVCAGGPVRNGDIHCRSREQDAAGPGVPRRLLSALLADRFFHQPGANSRDFSDSRSASGSFFAFFMLGPDPPTSPVKLRRSNRVRCCRGPGQLRFL